ncbi:hypothetical protein SLEP1_g18881 [Rubroshorea leprosula]|uniref:Uncharacterized protein n=1 Tax=Rubroshorea leprosula TaxID=152421 RepID=A0AAV5J9L6_9ROSI|nr:hypothetical protein SLEP1_g18881 [Rubroshorea leprosula]
MSVPSGGNKKGMPRKESWDDDEDSEVEIANISSEDKDLRKDSKGGVGACNLVVATSKKEEKGKV